MHAPFPSSNAWGAFYGGVSYLTSPCIGLFFMLSGALLLPVRGNMTAFLKHRMGRIIAPTIVWTLIYLLLEYDNHGSAVNIRALLSIPFSPQGHGVMWFMYALMGVYLVAPIVSPWLTQASRRECVIVLSLWAVTLLFPFLHGFLEITEDINGTFYYFSGYLGYFLCGYFIVHYKPVIKWYLLVPIVAVALVLPTLNYGWGLGLDKDVFWYLGICTAVLTVAIFYVLTVKFNKKMSRWFTQHRHAAVWLVRVSQCTFGIYLCHIIVMRYCLWNMPWFVQISNCVVQTSVSFVVTFAVSFAVVACLRKLSVTRRFCT